MVGRRIAIPVITPFGFGEHRYQRTEEIERGRVVYRLLNSDDSVETYLLETVPAGTVPISITIEISNAPALRYHTRVPSGFSDPIEDVIRETNTRGRSMPSAITAELHKVLEAIHDRCVEELSTGQ